MRKVWLIMDVKKLNTNTKYTTIFNVENKNQLYNETFYNDGPKYKCTIQQNVRIPWRGHSESLIKYSFDLINRYVNHNSLYIY